MLCFLAAGAFSAELLLVKRDAQWRYSTNGAAPGPDWNQPTHDDSTWAVGAAPFGFPSTVIWLQVGGEVPTVLPAYGPDGVTPITTYFFRTPFVYPEGQFAGWLVITNLLDNGAVYYLNGLEIGRFKMPTGPITTNTSGYFPPEGAWLGTNAPAAGLRPGTNWLAVELHQAFIDYGDAVFWTSVHAVLKTPVAITRQPDNQTVQENNPLHLTVSATGDDISYAWYKNGMPLPDATNASFYLPQIKSTNAGEYFVIVTNHVNQLTSTVAHVAVTADNSSPVVLSAVEDLSTTNTITVRFSEPVRPNTAILATNYVVRVRGSDQTLPVRIVVMANSETVRLRTDAWQTNRAYELIITRVRDASINSNLIQMATPVPISFFHRNVTALPAGSFWAWDDSGMDLGSDWREPDYPDTAWPRGQAGFYFGSRTMPFCGASKSTWITFGYTTYYFRTAFQLTDAAGFGHLRLRHFVDDAAVFYLNGVEVGRVRMPMGTIDAYTPPAVATNLPGCQTLSLSVSNLVTGQNVLAVELHDALPDGFADLAFDLELAMDYVFVPPTPRLEMHISRPTDGALELDWTGGPGTLLHAPQPQGPWGTLGTNNPAVFLPTNAAGFFRVQGLW